MHLAPKRPSLLLQHRVLSLGVSQAVRHQHHFDRAGVPFKLAQLEIGPAFAPYALQTAQSGVKAISKAKRQPILAGYESATKRLEMCFHNMHLSGIETMIPLREHHSILMSLD